VAMTLISMGCTSKSYDVCP